MKNSQIMAHLCIAIAAASIMSSCSFQILRKDLQEIEQLGVVEGSVTSSKAIKGNVIAVVVRDDVVEPRIVSYKIFSQHKGFSFFLPPAKGYRVFVFEDKNRDEKYQPTERIVQSPLVSVDNSDSKHTLKLVLPAKNSDETDSQVRELRSKIVHDVIEERQKIGTIVNLDDAFFDEENVQIGFWQPLTFVRNVPFGLFFLEEYTAEKIPVVFVHGVNGSPRHFASIIAELDRSRFQPWVVYYPSGFSISLVGQYLEGAIDEMALRHGFQNVKVIAHSMGGLVSRSMINLHNTKKGQYEIDTFITISTPWNGHIAAEMGLKYAPAIVPVWEDIVPGSTFLEELFNEPLPEKIKHYLLFGFKGSSSFTGGNSDGVVSIASELRPEAQEGAFLIRGFDEDHLGILSDNAVITLINTLLAK